MRKQPNRKWKDVSRKRRINKQNKKEIRTFVTNPISSTGTNVDPTPQQHIDCGYGEAPCWVINPISTQTGGFWTCCQITVGGDDDDTAGSIGRGGN